jgi:hypothetical protein
LDGESNKTSSVLSAKIVAFYLPIMIKARQLRTGLSGLKNGY